LQRRGKPLRKTRNGGRSMEDSDFVREYCRVQTAVKSARKEILRIMGHTEETLRDLEDKAFQQMDCDFIQNEFGIVQKVPDKPIQFRMTKQGESIWKYKLHFKPTEE
jgi:hypothetical protein